MEEVAILWQGRHWTSAEWYQYQEALRRSEGQWREADKEFLERYPIPSIVIDGKPHDEWAPKINDKRIIPPS